MILTSKVRAMEPKMLKETLKDFACFEERFVLAKRTHEVSLLTEGMLVLDKTLMGVIEIDPKEILVDGIRKELGKTLAALLHEGFIFSSAAVSIMPVVCGVRGTCTDIKSAFSSTSSTLSARCTFICRILSSEMYGS